MYQQIKMLAPKSENLSSSPEPTWGELSDFHKFPLTSHVCIHEHTYTYTLNIKTKNRQELIGSKYLN